MTKNNTIEEYIKGNEVLRLMPDDDSLGLTTIGYGRCLETNGITQDEADMLFANDINVVADELRKIFLDFDSLRYSQQKALMDMCFNLGSTRLRRFKKMIAAIEAGDFNEAAVELLDSRYAKQLPRRAGDNAILMRLV
ncbi:MAG: glycoside hydrolase family protein [Methylococcales bacterium]|jgi:lysozyme|nr:glycoside hydrolase family protein [Methylococcales bacterium]MBT3816167.1 glycoside hydrolase family protein [Methylococcales bacterium]MBT4032086.1 glycoside hydrolase family protein [Methylococcales bacterium]MBT4600057.1 glycoside hydrolase family protein [Methylococcales bacterium]MBT4664061.1 glycoside hydrolase family protein [Methylococcales bacterium]